MILSIISKITLFVVLSDQNVVIFIDNPDREFRSLGHELEGLLVFSHDNQNVAVLDDKISRWDKCYSFWNDFLNSYDLNAIFIPQV